MKISKQLEKEILDFCTLNNIIDTDRFYEKIVGAGFNIEKYGNAPTFTQPKENPHPEFNDTPAVVETKLEQPKKINTNNEDYDVYD